MVPKEMHNSWAVSESAYSFHQALQKKGSLELRIITGALIALDMCALLLISVGSKCLITTLPFLVRAVNNCFCRH